MYRVAKKTTKKTEYFCLKCKHLKAENPKIQPFGCFVECGAENKCFQGSFNAKYYYCKEYKGFNDMTQAEIEKIIQKQREMEALKQKRKREREEKKLQKKRAVRK